MRVMLMARPSAPLIESAMFGMRTALAGSAGQIDSIDPSSLPALPGFRTDERFAASPLDAGSSSTLRRAVAGNASLAAREAEILERADDGMLLVRGSVEDDALSEAREKAEAEGFMMFSDPRIATSAKAGKPKRKKPKAKETPTPAPEEKIVCDEHGPVGTASDVAARLGAGRLVANGYDGRGVAIAMVDAGVNIEHLRRRGRVTRFDPHLSWAPHPFLVPGDMPVGHGTMTAYAAGIAAPEATLLDLAVIAQDADEPFASYLSDASRVYGTILLAMMSMDDGERPYHSLVVSNSWGVPHESFETFPPGDPGRYIDNPNHPFNLQVANLARCGADILFAAGNCGPDCPTPACRGESENTIMGANGHPDVTCVAGATVDGTVTGYSSKGPGRLAAHKPDITGYTHFDGSRTVHATIPDKGTSTACPVVAGVVAAIRSRVPYQRELPGRDPAILRQVMTDRAHPHGDKCGWNERYGYGLVNAAPLDKAERGKLEAD